MIRLVFALAFSMLSSFTVAVCQWTQLPGKGTHQCLAICATDNALVAATQDSNVYRSTDQGVTWVHSSQGILDSLYTRTLYSDGNSIYLGAHEGGYVSNDGGRSWQKLDIGLPRSGNIYAFLRSGSTVFMVGDSGVFRSSDDGQSWQIKNVGVPPHSTVFSIAADDQYIYIGTNRQGILRTSDNGEHWTLSGTSSPLNAPIGGLWAANGYVIGLDLGGGWVRSMDHGDTWKLNPGRFVVVGPVSVAYCALREQRAVICGAEYGLIRSTDFGVKWEASKFGPVCHVVSLCVSDGYLYAATPEAWIWRRPLSEILPPAGVGEPVAPYALRLNQNVPNPTAFTTEISYSLPNYTAVSLKLYDAMMQEVFTVIDELQEAGEHHATLDVSGLPSGIYYYRLSTGTSSLTQRMLVVK